MIDEKFLLENCEGDTEISLIVRDMEDGTPPYELIQLVDKIDEKNAITIARYEFENAAKILSTIGVKEG